MSGDASNSITEYGAEFHLPLSEESEAEIWLLHRMQGVCQINLGSAKAPLNLHNQLPDNCIVHRLLANLQQAPSPSLALHLSGMDAYAVDKTLVFVTRTVTNTGGFADPEPLLSPPQIQLLQSPCVSLTVGPGLLPQYLLHIHTLTGLTYLKLHFAKTDQEWMIKGILMDSLTEVTSAQ
ncbi:TPA: hypothetical protein ACH3X2_010487 [Trebouxia sp. C0005]